MVVTQSGSQHQPLSEQGYFILQEKGIFRRPGDRKSTGREGKEKIRYGRAAQRINRSAVTQGLAVGFLVLKTINNMVLHSGD